MVSIVLVSHSRELSIAVKALADQQIQGRAVIVAVGGSDNPHQPFGTDPVAIADAIQSVYSDDGVLVLMDMGSAVISGRVALDLLEPGQTQHIHLCAGPFIEGAMAAAVQASIGMDLAAVAREAEEAIQAKRTVLLHDDTGLEQAMQAPGEPDSQTSAEVNVVNPAGLHFGPAARFVQAVARFGSHVTVTNLSNQTGPADAARFNQLLGLGIEQHHRILITATGADAAATVRELTEMVANDVSDHAPAVAVTPLSIDANGAAVLQGLAASPGLAIGTAVVLPERQDPLRAAVPYCETQVSPDIEWGRLQEALRVASQQLDELAAQVTSTLGNAQAAIFQAHALMLRDRDLLADLRAQIECERLPAGMAIQRVFLQAAERWRGMAGEVFQERAADAEDLGRRLLRILQGEHERLIDLPPDTIVVAYDLSPSQTATLDRSRVLGFCTATGGPNAHSAILARSMGIPAVVGIGALLLQQIRSNDTLAVDGNRGHIIVAPDMRTAVAFGAAQTDARAARQASWRAARRPTATRDGLRVEVVANLGTATDAALALEAGAEGVGLLRTEFLFQDRKVPPSEEEQYIIYRQVAEQMGNRPLVIRTLDIGGDKPALYLAHPHESNPFLGWRAIRISLTMPELFKTQLRALLRAAIHGNTHIMFPMISTGEEVIQGQALLAAAISELVAAGVPHRADVPLGIMIEVPAAAQMADQLAPLVDFFSIGTNDLTQYIFAADRTNERVAGLADPLHPAVLRQIDTIIRAAHAHGRWCGLCGELAGQPEAIPILLGLGLDEFSMAPASIPPAKQLIGRLTMPAARRLAQKVLAMSNATAVRAAARELLD